jgi:hypothetical protein
MGGFETEGGPNSKPGRALGKAVVGPLLATAARRFRDREAFFCAGPVAASALVKPTNGAIGSRMR